MNQRGAEKEKDKNATESNAEKVKGPARTGRVPPQKPETQQVYSKNNNHNPKGTKEVLITFKKTPI